MWVTSSKLHNLAIRLSNEQNTYDICIFNNYSTSVCWLWDGRIFSYPTSASGVIVLLKAPTKHQEFFPTLVVKTTDFQQNFEQTRRVTIFGDHGIMVSIR